VLAQAGAIIVDDEEHAVAAASALAQTRITPNSAPGVALITAQAGPGLIVADALATQKVALPRLAAATREKLAGLLPPLTYQDNPVDTGRPGEGFSEVVAAVAADPSIDILGVYAITEPVIDLPAAVSESGVIDVIPIVGGRRRRAATRGQIRPARRARSNREPAGSVGRLGRDPGEGASRASGDRVPATSSLR
jgi:acetyltransferase